MREGGLQKLPQGPLELGFAAGPYPTGDGKVDGQVKRRKVAMAAGINARAAFTARAW
jgi:hypothetical protein